MSNLNWNQCDRDSIQYFFYLESTEHSLFATLEENVSTVSDIPSVPRNVVEVRKENQTLLVRVFFCILTVKKNNFRPIEFFTVLFSGNYLLIYCVSHSSL